MINFHTLTTSAYNQDLYAFLKTPGMEGFDLNPYRDSTAAHLPTMGVGFNLTDPGVMQAVATELLGTHLTPSLLSAIGCAERREAHHSS
jgi:hypothetical protein